MNLVESSVVFDSEHHTYTLDGQQLSGVTPIVHWLFPDTYKGIPQSVLNAAADYGSAVHLKCEMYDSLGICNDDVVASYKNLIDASGLNVACSEYLVSDEQHIASCIDKVFDNDDLGDIKTTSKVHEKNVQVQLSIYAYLYELQTGRQAGKLWLIWLPKPQYGSPMVKELPRIPAEVCKYVVEVYAEGGDVTCAMAAIAPYLVPDKEKRVEGEIPEQWQEVVHELIMIKKQLDVLGEREKEIKTRILAAMEANGEDKWSSDLIQFSRRGESERESIDAKALKANEPSIYESYKKVAKVAASLTYKVL